MDKELTAGYTQNDITKKI